MRKSITTVPEPIILTPFYVFFPINIFAFSTIWFTVFPVSLELKTPYTITMYKRDTTSLHIKYIYYKTTLIVKDKIRNETFHYISCRTADEFQYVPRNFVREILFRISIIIYIILYYMFFVLYLN